MKPGDAPVGGRPEIGVVHRAQFALVRLDDLRRVDGAQHVVASASHAERTIADQSQTALPRNHALVGGAVVLQLPVPRCPLP